ncbi:hypothetical protein, partial [Escherichia coli]|uniref:hypothetical protein n=1 Tax=Escherichia coli TaxID=562 RepID=UPI001BC8A8FC
LQGKISSDGCLKKEQMVVSAIASTPQADFSVKGKIFIGCMIIRCVCVYCCEYFSVYCGGDVSGRY